MLTVTTAAWDRLSKLQSTRPEVTTMRLKIKDGRPMCNKGSKRKDDRVIDLPNRPVLLMTQKVASKLSDQTLDAPKTKRGPRLRLKEISR